MIALVILGALLFLIILVLFVPLNVSLKFRDEFYVKISFLKIKLFEIPKNKKSGADSKKVSKGETSSEENTKKSNKGKEIFSFLKEKYGFFGAVKKLLALFSDMLAHIKKLLRHIKIKNIRLAITVSGEDAAATAIEYGQVCSVAYPILSYLDSFSTVKFKKIDIKSDFVENKKDFEFSLDIKLQIIYMLIAAFKIYKDYKNFTLKENYNERK